MEISALLTFVIMIVAPIMMIIAMIIIRDSVTGRCPRCREAKAQVKTREQILGIFNKRINVGKYDEKKMETVPCEKVRVHFRCKYCSHEWTMTETRRI